MKADAALAGRWRSFAFDAANELVRTIGTAVHAASPETRMCEQQPGACFPEHRGLYEACHTTTGLPVGMRPGAGSYYDYDPRDQIQKAYDLALQMDTIGPPDFVDRICPEIETCPRSFSCRTGRGVLLEALECLSQGMNSISALAIDAGFESPEWYGDEILAPLARNAAMMKRYIAASEGAVRAGYGIVGRKWMRGVDGSPRQPFFTSSLPLKPLLSSASIYLFFLNHPEGIQADTLPLHWQELYKLYAHESVFDNKQLILNTIQSLCSNSKSLFYTSVSRIKKKFITTFGTRKARHYIIMRQPDGIYRIGRNK